MNKTLNVLYVEDDKDIREEMVEILELYFDNLDTATNGKEGLEKCKNSMPELVITDIQMPLMDGLTMSKEILAIDSNVKIILTTAFTEQSYLEEAQKFGITYYVNKPININKLFEKIESIMN